MTGTSQEQKRGERKGDKGFTIAVFACYSLRLPTLHRIILFARARTSGGIVTPICLAAFRLMMKSISSAARLAGRRAWRLSGSCRRKQRGACRHRPDRVRTTSGHHWRPNLPEDKSPVNDFLSPGPRSVFGWNWPTRSTSKRERRYAPWLLVSKALSNFVGRFGPFENLVDKHSASSEGFVQADSVGHQATVLDDRPPLIDRWQAIFSARSTVNL